MVKRCDGLNKLGNGVRKWQSCSHAKHKTSGDGWTMWWLESLLWSDEISFTQDLCMACVLENSRNHPRASKSLSKKGDLVRFGRPCLYLLLFGRFKPSGYRNISLSGDWYRLGPTADYHQPCCSRWSGWSIQPAMRINKISIVGSSTCVILRWFFGMRVGMLYVWKSRMREGRGSE